MSCTYTAIIFSYSARFREQSCKNFPATFRFRFRLTFSNWALDSLNGFSLFVSISITSPSKVEAFKMNSDVKCNPQHHFPQNLIRRSNSSLSHQRAQHGVRDEPRVHGCVRQRRLQRLLQLLVEVVLHALPLNHLLQNVRHDDD